MKKFGSKSTNDETKKIARISKNTNDENAIAKIKKTQTAKDSKNTNDESKNKAQMMKIVSKAESKGSANDTKKKQKVSKNTNDRSGF